jgi:hypothetical protein
MVKNFSLPDYTAFHPRTAVRTSGVPTNVRFVQAIQVIQEDLHLSGKWCISENLVRQTGHTFGSMKLKFKTSVHYNTVSVHFREEIKFSKIFFCGNIYTLIC